MSRAGSPIALCGVMLLATVAALAAPQGPSRDRVRIPAAAERAILDAVAAYAGGDNFAAERWLASRATRTYLSYLDLVMTRDTTPWHRSKPMFLLEVATALPTGNTSSRATLLKTGWALLVSRPSVVGVDPAEDRFELLWYQAALGIAQGIQQYWLQQDLLDIVAARFSTAASQAVLAETRLPLGRGIAAAGLCCWKPVGGEVIQQVSSGNRRSVNVEQAVSLFAAAARIPALRIEALIRAGVLLQKMGRPSDALQWLDQVPPHEDGALAYVQHLTHGRVLDGANRATDAAAAYLNALHYEPSSQLAAIGRAAALLRAGQDDDATRAAEAAMALGSEQVTRFDAAFRQADARFVPGWLSELRKLRR
jgi:tetratricopeptide (TPR) repeat protein